MERPKGTGVMNDTTERIRYMRALMEQAKGELGEWNRMQDEMKKGHMRGDEKEEQARCLSWLKEELHTIRELEGREIEGVICAGMRRTDENIQERGK